MPHYKNLLKTGVISTLACVMFTGVAAAKPALAAPPPIEAPVVAEQTTSVPVTIQVDITSGHLNVRSTPSTSASRVGTLKNGETATVISQQDGWYQISFGTGTGYVSKDYVKVIESKTVTVPAAVEASAAVATAEAGAPAPDVSEEADGDEAMFVQVTISSGNLNVRSGPSTSHSRVGTMKNGSVATVITQQDGWYEITDGEITGFVSGDYVKQISEDEAIAIGTTPIKAVSAAPAGSSKGAELASFAQQFKGCPYVYGAAGPKKFDCSGFTMYIFKQYGYSLPHTATGQLSYGSEVSRGELQPGDLVFFRDTSISKKAASHVGIYIGDGKFIHASSSRGRGKCVVVSSLSDSYYNSHYTAARRLAV